MKLFFTVVAILLILSPFTANSRQIAGKVLSEDEQSPLPGASVFLVNTTIGTTTLHDGSFLLNDIPAGKFQLAVSFVGYETLSLQIPVEGINYYKIILKPDVKQLAALTISAKKESNLEWQNNLDLFTKYFLGRGTNSAQCKILNPEVLSFQVADKVFDAYASAPVQIENRALGYRINYSLDYFNYNLATNRINYDGYPQFFEIQPESELEKEQWEAARLDSFKGSMMHFMRSFFERSLLENGFVLRDVEEEVNFRGKSQLVAAVGDTTVTFPAIFNKKHVSYYTQHYKSIMDTIRSTPEYPLLSFRNRLEVKYLGEPESYDYQKANRDPSEIGYVRPQTSFLTLLQPSVGVQRDGQFFDSKDIFCEGYWTWELMADALPVDYVPAEPLENFSN